MKSADWTCVFDDFLQSIEVGLLELAIVLGISGALIMILAWLLTY